ncbi:outer membrane usher protein [Serratia fonticola]|uniref:outer membrane usher protein n=1 Tax=Serratia fonticola TaxID=47917 RepID=UPI0015C68DCC|nr:outer membrane usher protein [Serratia fonticola]MBC3378119.1 outer membrane usher protein [Serratia fonticola]NYA37319.1 outer membrane usher protein [Serratia fonticola]
MKLSPAGKLIRLRVLGFSISLALSAVTKVVVAAEEIEFNTEALDVNDRKNINLSQFSRGGYIMPGVYSMVVNANKDTLPEQQISFYTSPEDPNNSRACVNKALVEQLSFKESIVKDLTWWHQGECLDERDLKGMEVRGDLSTATLYLNIPQAYLEFTAENWDPPSRWEDGLPGLLLDYNTNMQMQRQLKTRTDSYNLSGNGVAGANLGSWRLRADWQAYVNSQHTTKRPLNWTRYYAYRAIAALRSKLTVGDNYLNSDIFDSFNFRGVSLISDDNMLPPNLRGYAPEVVGVAKTNAKVTISQQGRVLYETQVAAGPFHIQDINDTVSGELEVRVEEQDGSVQVFNLNTASIPYLTRPGSVRFKLAMGKTSDWQRRSSGVLFSNGEFSWGVSNGWSLYGGLVQSKDYNAASLGLGRDLMILGALSFDATQSWSHLPASDSTLSGSSYRLSYSKSFDDYNSQVTFAGYRFSQQDFMSMSQYLDARLSGNRPNNNKEMYTITFNTQLQELASTLYLNYDHQTYWNRPTNDRYNLTIASYFDIGAVRNLSLSLSAYRNRYNGIYDNGLYLSLSLPWGRNSHMNYNTTVNRGDTTYRASYYNRPDEKDNYQLSLGNSRKGNSLSGYYSHEGDLARINANINYQQGSYSSLGLNTQGGMTLTPQGGALHRAGVAGGTRMLIDTHGVSGVPIRGYGGTSNTNAWGKAVIGDVNSYYRNQASIDLNKLSDNADANQSVVQATLTEGAIGYRRFEVISGEKNMAVITLADGSVPPFGATVSNALKQETGIVIDGGSVYLSGIKAGENMTVYWNGKAQCEVRMPAPLPPEMLMNTLLLPCQPASTYGLPSTK